MSTSLPKSLEPTLGGVEVSFPASRPVVAQLQALGRYPT
jgi:hypothetical protein